MDAEQKKEFMNLLTDLFSVLKNKLNLKTVPQIILKKDSDNANNILGKTAYYNPKDKNITLFILNNTMKIMLLKLQCNIMIPTMNSFFLL